MRDRRDISIYTAKISFCPMPCTDKVGATGIYSLDREASLTYEFCCTSRCKESDSVVYQTLRKVKESSLIEDGENR